MEESVRYIFKTWDELSKDELYASLRLRAIIFVVEQDCPYVDPDNKDQEWLHVMGFREEQLVAYARISPLNPSKMWIGRIVVDESVRGMGVGHQIVDESIQWIKNNAAPREIIVEAQEHLEKFYGSHGFIATGQKYLEDGIPHITMALKN